MPDYNIYPAVDENYNFPPEVLQAAANSTQFNSAFGVAVAQMVPTEVARVIGSDPTVKNAAAAAVTAEVADRNLVETRSNSILKVDGNPLTVFSIVDADGKRTWLEIAYDGGPTDYSIERIMEKVPYGPNYPTLDWAHWGDSMTDDRTMGAESWVAKLATRTGRQHYMGGWWGQSATQIAARQGGLPALVNVQGFVIPQSGSVAITGMLNSPVLPHATRFVAGTLAGVKGNIRQLADGTTRFTRTSSGPSVSCPQASPFYPDDALNMRNRMVTIWSGRNDVFSGFSPQMLVASVKAQIDYLSPSVKRALVMEIVPANSSNASHPLLLAHNNALKAAFPSEWTPVATWLRSDQAASYAGITLTAEDRTQIAAGYTPESLRADEVHLNKFGNTAVAKYIWDEAFKRGWVA
jgi:hypothetical protein